jgi:nucleoid DNA-binding protein
MLEQTEADILAFYAFPAGLRAGGGPRPLNQHGESRCHFRMWEEALALTQTQLIAAVAERSELSKAEAKRALAALDEVVLDELSNAQKVRIAGLVQLSVRVKAATKARKGRNPATGEEITIAAKPASVDVRARPLAKAKEALPSVQKARRRLAVKS